MAAPGISGIGGWLCVTNWYSVFGEESIQINSERKQLKVSQFTKRNSSLQGFFVASCCALFSTRQNLEEVKTSTDTQDKGMTYKVTHVCNFLLYVCSHFLSLLSVVVKSIVKSNSP